MGLTGTPFAVALALAIYFAPAIVAVLRGSPSALPVFLVDLFLGWTVVGWIVALWWSLSGPSGRTAVLPAPSPPPSGQPPPVSVTRICPHCGAESSGRFCPRCGRPLG